MNGEGATYPLIYFQREPPPRHFPLVWHTFGLHPMAKKKEVWGRGESEGGKKNLEMFSSGCNLSLSWLQHSRVIRQHSPVRRTEVALCLGLTQAHIHLKPLLSLGCHNRRCCRWAACRYLVFFFLADLVFTPDSEQWSLEFYPVRLLSDAALVMRRFQAKLPIIGCAIDKSISFVSALRRNITVLNTTLIFSP